ncbi:hypothetical protein Y1Q_0013708 [Alligator mississippiensis]|uniref:Uncharacterized protein n=1 Tax=Alligator mississippiensis TaxID=8496 RepID=A0A151NVR6_ALLMI|nr:hypothetical protein Y1Q_0013708 [Alligator mississippiensis]
MRTLVLGPVAQLPPFYDKLSIILFKDDLGDNLAITGSGSRGPVSKLPQPMAAQNSALLALQQSTAEIFAASRDGSVKPHLRFSQTPQ